MKISNVKTYFDELKIKKEIEANFVRMHMQVDFDKFAVLKRLKWWLRFEIEDEW